MNAETNIAVLERLKNYCYYDFNDLSDCERCSRKERCHKEVAELIREEAQAKIKTGTSPNTSGLNFSLAHEEALRQAKILSELAKETEKISKKNPEKNPEETPNKNTDISLEERRVIALENIAESLEELRKDIASMPRHYY